MMSDNTKNNPARISKEGGEEFFQQLAQYIMSQCTKEEIPSLLSVLASLIESNGGTD